MLYYFCISYVSQYYFRYDGSITSPPCSEKVEWRIMEDPLVISLSQMHRLEMLTAMYIDYPTCQLATWGKPRDDATCKVDVNRPVQYLSHDHEMKDCQRKHDGGQWDIEKSALDENGQPLSPMNVTKSELGMKDTRANAKDRTATQHKNKIDGKM